MTEMKKQQFSFYGLIVIKPLVKTSVIKKYSKPKKSATILNLREIIDTSKV